MHHDGTTPHAAALPFVNSSSESFKKDLYKAIDATGATLAFDAIGDVEFGWLLLMRFLAKLEPVRIVELYKRVADEINTTFAIESMVELSFEELIFEKTDA